MERYDPIAIAAVCARSSEMQSDVSVDTNR